MLLTVVHSFCVPDGIWLAYQIMIQSSNGLSICSSNETQQEKKKKCVEEDKLTNNLIATLQFPKFPINNI